MSSVTEGKKLHKNEAIKENSVNLRSTLAEELDDVSSGAISADASQISKFHGMYVQDDRDVRKERRSKKLDKAYIFMLRLRIPGGIITPAQYLKLDQLATDYGNNTLRLTTRQTFQFHGVLKFNLRTLVRGIHEVTLDSKGACGDINRNVMCHPNLSSNKARQELFKMAAEVSRHLLPRGNAYHELFIDGEKVSTEAEEEPIYGKTYLPRKFKIGFAVPPSNDVDVFSQDLGFIAIYEGDRLQGFNVTVGGGMGMSHGNEKTYPRVADIMGFCKPEDVVKVAEAVVLAQRDHGDRVNRAHARLKYTIDDHGIDWFREEVEKRSGLKLEKPRPFKFERIADDYGWHKDVDGNWYYVQFVQNGRIKDDGEIRMKSAFREVAKVLEGDIRMTPSQNLAFCRVSDEQKPAIEAILREHGVPGPEELTGLRRNSMACVALPTCGLALAESERALPSIVDEIEKMLDEVGLRDDDISIRMTGCPNGCARPYLAEIGLVGKAPGKYNLYLGANYEGLRLNTVYAESVKPEEALEKLKPVIQRYAKERNDGERFGDFCVRQKIVEIPEKSSVAV